MPGGTLGCGVKSFKLDNCRFMHRLAGTAPREPRARPIPAAKGDLLDRAWVSIAVGNQPAGLVEAMGTYYRDKMNAPMKRAAGCPKYRVLGSGRWAEDPVSIGYDRPILSVVYPDSHRENLEEGETVSLRAGMVREQLARSLRGFGLPKVAAAFEAEAPDARQQLPRPLRQSWGEGRSTLSDDRRVAIVGAVMVRLCEDR